VVVAVVLQLPPLLPLLLPPLPTLPPPLLPPPLLLLLLQLLLLLLLLLVLLVLEGGADGRVVATRAWPRPPRRTDKLLPRSTVPVHPRRYLHDLRTYAMRYQIVENERAATAEVRSLVAVVVARAGRSVRS
jgi:hypothetical protein